MYLVAAFARSAEAAHKRIVEYRAAVGKMAHSDAQQRRCASPMSISKKK
jgi:hypothetical protein